MIIIDDLACPTDLIILLFHILKQKKTTHTNNIDKYSYQASRISGIAPKNVSKGLANMNHNIDRTIENSKLEDWNVQKVFETSS